MRKNIALNKYESMSYKMYSEKTWILFILIVMHFTFDRLGVLYMIRQH